MQKFFPLARKPFICNDDQRAITADLKTETPIPVGNLPGAFGAVRSFDVHTGVDLYAEDGQEVYAIADGEVELIFPFTGEQAGCPWWLDTDALVVRDSQGEWLYGEVEVLPHVKLGGRVHAGEHIANVKRVLRNDKGRPTSMLHLERYVSMNTGYAPIWNLGEHQPWNLRNPIPWLLQTFEPPHIPSRLNCRTIPRILERLNTALHKLFT